MFFGSVKNNFKYASYPSETTTYEWHEKAPNVSKIDSNLKPFLKSVKVYEEVKHNFQNDIDKQFLVTPEQIVKNNISIDLDKSKVVYTDMTKTNGLNALDVREKAKEQVKDIIHSQAVEIANKDMQDFFNKQKKSNIDEKKDDSKKESEVK